MKKLRPQELQSKLSTSHRTAKVELELLRNKIIDLVEKKPQKAAILLSQWINQSSSSLTQIKKIKK